MKNLINVAILSVVLAFEAAAEQVTCLYIKNNNAYPVFIWVNDLPQGMAPAGKTCLVPMEGFVTPDSGIQPDGTVKQTQANGGWEPTPTITVKAAGWTSEKNKDGKEQPALVVWKVPGVGAANSNGDALVWLGEPALSEEDRQLAMKLPPGTPPRETIDTLPNAKNAPPQSQSLAAATAKGAEPVSPLWSGTGDGQQKADFKEILKNSVWQGKPGPILVFDNSGRVALGITVRNNGGPPYIKFLGYPARWAITDDLLRFSVQYTDYSFDLKKSSSELLLGQMQKFEDAPVSVEFRLVQSEKYKISYDSYGRVSVSEVEF